MKGSSSTRTALEIDVIALEIDVIALEIDVIALEIDVIGLENILSAGASVHHPARKSYRLGQ